MHINVLLTTTDEHHQAGLLLAYTKVLHNINMMMQMLRISFRDEEDLEA